MRLEDTFLSPAGCCAGIVMGLLLLEVGEAWCQQYDRRARDEPEVCLEAGGRYGTCDVLGFTPDGKNISTRQEMTKWSACGHARGTRMAA